MEAPRRLLPVLAAVTLALPASAHAQGAGDDQYQDPFASQESSRAQTQTQTEPGLSGRPPARPTPAAPAPAVPPPAPAATPQAAAPAPANPLPVTGMEIPGMALLGLGMLAAGVGLRLRTVDASLY